VSIPYSICTKIGKSKRLHEQGVNYCGPVDYRKVDRGYPSIELFIGWKSRKKFVMILSSFVTIKYTYVRLNKIKKTKPEIYEEIK